MVGFPFEVTKWAPNTAIDEVQSAATLQITNTPLRFDLKAVDVFHTREQANPNETRNFGIVYRMTKRTGFAVMSTSTGRYTFLLRMDNYRRDRVQGLRAMLRSWIRINAVIAVWKVQKTGRWTACPNWRELMLNEKTNHA